MFPRQLYFSHLFTMLILNNNSDDRLLTALNLYLPPDTKLNSKCINSE